MDRITSRLRRLAARSLTFAAGLALGSWHLGCIGCYDLEWSGTTEESRPEDYRCELPSPCPEIYDGTGVEPPYDSIGGACILDSLRAGEPGTHMIQEGCGAYRKTTTIQVFEDGDVLWEVQNLNDFNLDIHETWRVLPEPEYFDGCDAETIDSLLECMNGILDQPCAGGSPPCSKS